MRKHIFDRRRSLCGPFAGRLFLTIQGNFAGTAFIFNDGQNIACRWHAAKAKNLNRCCGASFGNLLALIVDQRADFARFPADNKDVAAFQCAAFDKHSGNSAAALIQLRLDNDGFGCTIRIGTQFHQFGLQRQLFEQGIKAGLFQSRNFDILNIAAHRLDDNFMFQQAFANLLRVGAFLIHFVDRDDHRHASGL